MSTPDFDGHQRGNRIYVFKSYAKSLAWVALAFAVAVSFSIVTELILFDYVHGNPHRTKENAAEMMALFPPLFSVISVIGCGLVFGLPQAVQASIHASVARFGRVAVLMTTVSLLPAVAILTWYCWEYLTPTDMNLGINEGPDWQPYVHGITLRRYAGALAFQTSVTAFSVLHCDPSIIRTTRHAVVACGLAAAVLVGVGMGVRRETADTAQLERNAWPS